MPQAFARNTLLGFISGAAVSVAGFVGTALAARLLGPGGMGVVAYAVWCIMVAQTIADLGIALVLQRFIPSLRAEGKHNEAEGLIGATARLSVLAAVVGSGLLFVWLYWPGSSAVDASSGASRWVLITLAIAAFIASNAASIYMAYLKGEQRFGELAKVSAVCALIRLLATILGAWLFGVAGALAAYVAANVIQTWRFRQLLRKQPAVDNELKRHVIRFTVTGWLAGVVGGLVWGRTEIVFLEHYSGIDTVGLFAAASLLTEMALQLPGLLLSALLPYFSEQHGQGAHDQIHRMYRKITGLLALLIVPLCIGAAATAPVFVPLLFGPKFANAVPAVMVLLVAAAITGLGTTTIRLMNSTGRNGFLLISNALGLAGTILLGFLVIPRFGLMGAAWSRAVVQVIVVAIETWYVTRKLGVIPPYRALGAITLAAVIQGAVAFGLITWLGGILSLVLAVAASVAVYVLALRFLSVISMVDPTLVDSVNEHIPRRLRPWLSWILKLVSPGTRRDAAPE